MLQKLSSFLLRIANWKTFVAALALYMVFGGYVMPHGAATISKLAGKPVQILDLQFFGYSAEKANKILAEYTPEAREYTAFFSLVADGVYPLVYTFLYIISMAWVFKVLTGDDKKGYYYLHLLPLAAMVIDYCENACIINLVKDYPNFPGNLVTVSSFFTCFKWSLAGIQTVVLLGGVVALVVVKLRKK